MRKVNKEYNNTKKYSKKLAKIQSLYKDLESVTDKEPKKKRKNTELENYYFPINLIQKYISEKLEEFSNYYKNECEKFERE